MVDDDDIFRLGLGALVLAAAVIRRRDLQEGEGGHDNTYNLPEGEPITAMLRRWLRRQQAEVLDAIPDAGPLPDAFPDLDAAQWNDPMATAMTPIIGGYWDESGKDAYARLGLDPGTWQVANPKLSDQIRRQSFSFCQSTNQTTTLRLDAALQQMRDAFEAGLVSQGDTLPGLTKRVQEIFTGLSDRHAELIAATEASRAVHAAQLMADDESGVVAGVELLLSSDACPLCRKVATECRRVRLGEAFAIIGTHPEYSTIRHVPIHPYCQCTMIEVLLPEYGGPPDPKWGKTLVQPQKDLPKEGGYKPPPGKKVPPPEPEKPKPVVSKSPVPGGALLPDRPIAERLAAYTEGDRKVAKILEIDQDRQKLWRELVDRQQKLNERLEELDLEIVSIGKKPGYATSKKLRAKVGELQAEFKAVTAERNDVRAKKEATSAESRSQIRQFLAPPGGRNHAISWHAAAPGNIGVDTLRLADEGKDFVTSVLHKGGQPWADHRSVIGLDQIPVKDDQRAFYRPSTRTVHLEIKTSASTVVHELGHALDVAINSSVRGQTVEERSAEFLAYRVGNETPQSLDKLYPGFGYSASEMGRKDKFDQAFTTHEAFYVGKDYKGKLTEILAMGLQKLYDDPAGFAEKDPEYCKFVLGILDGNLR